MGGEKQRKGMSLELFCEVVMVYCSATGGSVTSWVRTVKHNKAVGGVKDSDHIYGRAVDVVYDEHVDAQRRKNIAEKHGLLLIIEADHDHLEPFRGR